ncbi:MAG: NYN domain-containing protein [Chloroflexi bacterium]|nr:NYN domain-containing protein [Chloroflexota bacterium]
MKNKEAHLKDTTTKPNIAVIIDVENINNVKSLRQLIDQLQQQGELTVKRAVGDWNRAIKIVQSDIRDLGFDLVHQKNLAPGHNSADTRIVIEALELLHNPGVDVETFAFVSSDQDFLPLYDRLRELGKSVIVAADANGNCARLVRHSDIFIPIAHAEETQIRAIHQQNTRKSNRKGVRVARNRMGKARRAAVEKLLIRSMQTCMNDSGVAQATNLYRTMRRLDPTFSVKKLGYARFERLLRSFSHVLSLRGKQSNNITLRLNRKLLRQLKPGSG